MRVVENTAERLVWRRRQVPALPSDRLHRHLVELDRGPSLARPRAHGVERIVAATHRLLTVEERDAEALPRLAVDEHEHLRALQTLRHLVRCHLAADHADRVVDVGGIAFEHRYACVHVASFVNRATAWRARQLGRTRYPRSTMSVAAALVRLTR